MVNYSKILDGLKKWAGLCLLPVIGFFTPAPYYRTIGKRPLKRSWIRLLQGFLLLSLITALTIHLFTPILVLGVFLAFLPFVMVSVSVDPFVSWLRGEEKRPWPTFWRYVSQGLWAVLTTLLMSLIALFVFLILDSAFLDVMANADIESPRSAGDFGFFLVFAIFVSMHFYYSQSVVTTRKSHKIVSSGLFGCLYIGMAVSPVLNTLG